MTAVAEAHRVVREELVRLAAPIADRVRELIDGAVARGDFQAVRSEGYTWSGWIGVAILQLAEAMEETASPIEGSKEGRGESQ